MRSEPTDLQGNNRYETPSCGNCGLPLAAGVTTCPFCDKRVSSSPHPGRHVLGVSERTLLLVAAGILALAGAVTIAAAFFS